MATVKATRERLDFATAALRGEVEHPKLDELVNHFFRAAGGTKNVAKILYNEFLNAKEGSLIRQRILDMILKHLKTTNEHEAAAGDLSLLSEEDLEREVFKLIGSDDSAATPEKTA